MAQAREPLQADDSGSEVPGVVALGVEGGLRLAGRKAAPPIPRAEPGPGCGAWLVLAAGVFCEWDMKAAWRRGSEVTGP